MRNRLIVKVTLKELVAALRLPEGTMPISVLDCRESLIENTISLVVDNPSFPPVLDTGVLTSYTLENLKQHLI